MWTFQKFIQENHQFESGIYFKLKEVELEAKTTEKRFSHQDVFSDLRKQLSEKATGDNV